MMTVEAVRGHHRADAAPAGRDPGHLDEDRPAGGPHLDRRCGRRRLADEDGSVEDGRTGPGGPRRRRNQRRHGPLHRCPLRDCTAFEDVQAAIEARSLAGPWRIEGSYNDGGLPVQFGISTGRFLDDGSIRVKTDFTPASAPLAIAADGVVKIDAEGPSYAGTYNLTQVVPADRERRPRRRRRLAERRQLHADARPVGGRSRDPVRGPARSPLEPCRRGHHRVWRQCELQGELQTRDRSTLIALSGKARRSRSRSGRLPPALLIGWAGFPCRRSRERSGSASRASWSGER